MPDPLHHDIGWSDIAVMVMVIPMWPQLLACIHKKCHTVGIDLYGTNRAIGLVGIQELFTFKVRC